MYSNISDIRTKNIIVHISDDAHISLIYHSLSYYKSKNLLLAYIEIINNGYYLSLLLLILVVKRERDERYENNL